MLPASICSSNGVQTRIWLGEKCVDAYACEYSMTVNRVVARHQVCTVSHRTTRTMTRGMWTTSTMAV